MQNENKEEMLSKTFWLGLLDDLRKQGFSVMILALGLYVLHQDNAHFKSQQAANRELDYKRIVELEAKVEQCNKEIISIYQEQNQKFINVMENISEHLKDF